MTKINRTPFSVPLQWLAKENWLTESYEGSRLLRCAEFFVWQKVKKSRNYGLPIEMNTAVCDKSVILDVQRIRTSISDK